MRSYRIGKQGLIGLMAAVIVVLAAAVVIAASSDPAPAPAPAADGTNAPARSVERSAPAPAARRSPRPAHRPSERRQARVARAGEWADGRAGRVAFAEVGPDGEVHGRNEHELFQSASVVKALILAAELQRLADDRRRLDPGTAAELRRMITVSDNDAATAVFDRVGPERVDAIAHRAGMRDFHPSESWGASGISAADMAVMFDDLGRVFPERFEKFGLGLLGSIVPEQSWGIPRVATERGWSVRFKGGWRPDPDGQIVNQAAELRRDGVRRSIAVLSDQQPSMAYGIETVEGISSRLLRGG
jgi:hypothetical protein